MPREPTTQRSGLASSLSLDLLRLAVWALFLLGLSTAPVDVTHASAKYLGEAAELALDTAPDAEPEEVDGDGSGIWLPPEHATALACTPSRLPGSAAASPVSCVRSALPARGPPELV